MNPSRRRRVAIAVIACLVLPVAVAATPLVSASPADAAPATLFEPIEVVAGGQGYRSGPADEIGMAPRDLAVRPDGSIVVAEEAVIRLVDPVAGTNTVVAGASYAHGVPTGMQFDAQHSFDGVAAGPDGEIYTTLIECVFVCGGTLVELDLDESTITPIAGGGDAQWGDGEPALGAYLLPQTVWAEPDGSLVFFTGSSGVSPVPSPSIVRLDRDTGLLQRLAGGGAVACCDWAGESATDLALQFAHLGAIVTAPDGTLYFQAHGQGSIWAVDPVTNVVEEVVDSARDARGIARLPDGALVTVVDAVTDRTLVAVDPSTATVDPIASLPQLRSPWEPSQEIAGAPNGSVLLFGRDATFAEHARDLLRVAPDGTITTVAGNGSMDRWQGDDVSYSVAIFPPIYSTSLVMGPDGRLYAVRDGGIAIVDPDTGLTTSVQVPGLVTQWSVYTPADVLGFDAAGRLLVRSVVPPADPTDHLGTHAVEAVDLDTGDLERIYGPTPAIVRAVGGPDGEIYVIDTSAGETVRIDDTGTETVVGDVVGEPAGLWVTPAGELFADFDGLYRLDPTGWTPVHACLGVFGFPESRFVSDGAGRFLAGRNNAAAEFVGCRYDPATGTEVDLAPAPYGILEGLAVDADGFGWYLSSNGLAKMLVRDTAPVTFEPLSVGRDGTGTGGVTSSPAGITCGDTCTADFPSAAVVTLTATPDEGSTFAGWSLPSCTASSTCEVTMSAATTVTAQFTRPTEIAATAIEVGAYHSCAIRSAALECWGYNGGRSPTAVPGMGTEVSAVSADVYQTCAVQGGAAKCWGGNGYGQLGDGTTADKVSPVPVTGLGSGATALATGVHHSCAIQNGAARCWGQNSVGQLGDGTTADRLTPVPVTGLGAGVTAITAGGYHTCAIQNGAAKCWGDHMRTPTTVPGLGTGVTAISAGYFHTCAIQNGAAKCWGHNSDGQLGNGTTSASAVPVAVTGLAASVTAISAGWYHSCAVQSGAARCWGGNGYGQLGDGTTTARHVPSGVTGLTSGVAAISGGGYHTCAIRDFVLECWGYGLYGQLGEGSHATRLVPVTAKPLGFHRATSGVLAGAGTDEVTSGAPAADHPLSTSVRAHGPGGAVTITEAPGSSTAAPAGYQLFGYQATINAPAGTAGQPLQLTFRIDPSIIPPGLVAADVTIMRNGTPVAVCANPAVVAAVPSPCVASATGTSATGMELVIHTDAASVWEFAISDTTPPTIAFSGDTTYTVDQFVHVECLPDDANGIASTTCPAVVSTSAHELVPGVTTFGATAVDLAGNEATGSVDVTIEVTAPGLCALTGQFVAASPSYGAGAKAQKSADKLVDAVCKELDKIEKELSKGRKPPKPAKPGKAPKPPKPPKAFDKLEANVQQLADAQWLTPPQAAKVVDLAGWL